jgi:hypothetical protein
MATTRLGPLPRPMRPGQIHWTASDSTSAMRSKCKVVNGLPFALDDGRSRDLVYTACRHALAVEAIRCPPKETMSYGRPSK